jgi:hypothetical protein
MKELHEIFATYLHEPNSENWDQYSQALDCSSNKDIDFTQRAFAVFRSLSHDSIGAVALDLVRRSSKPLEIYVMLGLLTTLGKRTLADIHDALLGSRNKWSERNKDHEYHTIYEMLLAP